MPTTSNPINAATKCRDLRTRFGMTQREWATRLGLSESQVIRIEGGRPTTPTIGILLDMIDAHGLLTTN